MSSKDFCPLTSEIYWNLVNDVNIPYKQSARLWWLLYTCGQYACDKGEAANIGVGLRGKIILLG
ncbi:MAG: hypothetical protein WAK17_14355 [Candidatus Nitrosopolaris sp.]